MTSVWPLLEPLLPLVQKPARYIGCEDGAQTPEHGPGKVSWLLTYPDTYEIGLPNQGLQILYELLNERDDAVAERSYAPWTDMEQQLREHGLPLFSVDTHRPAREFDVLAFNLSAELVYTNVLNCIDLAGIPCAEDADDDATLLFAESASRYLLEIRPEHFAPVAHALPTAAIRFGVIGRTDATAALKIHSLKSSPLLNEPIPTLTHSWRQTLDW